MSLFGGLNLKVASRNTDPDDAITTAATAAAETEAAAAANEPAPVNDVAGSVAATGQSMFSFLTASTPAPPPPAVELPQESTPPSPVMGGVSSFSFLGGGTSSGIEAPAEAAPAGSGGLAEDTSASALAAKQAQQEEDGDMDLLAPATMIVPANVRKKAPTSRVGFLRNGDSDRNAAAEAHSEDTVEGVEGASTDQPPQPEQVGQEESPQGGHSKAILPQIGANEGHQEEQEEQQEEGEEQRYEQEIHEEEKAPAPPAQDDDPLAGLQAQRVPTKAAPAEDHEQADLHAITATGEFGALLRSFRKSAGAFARTLQRVNDGMAALREEAERVEADAAALEERRDKCHQEQNAALETDDFEAAERLQRTLDALDRSAGEVASRRAGIVRANDALVDERDAALAGQVRCLEDVEQRVEVCEREEAAASQAAAKIAKHEAEAGARALDEEDEQLRVESEGIATDLEVVDKELGQINEKVDSSTVELRTELNEWAGKAADEDERIAALEQELAERREARASVQVEIDRVEGGIQAARSKYELRLQELDQRRKAVCEKQEAVKLRAKKVAEDRSAQEEKRRNAEELVAGGKVRAEEIARQMKVVRSIAERLRTENEGGSRKQRSEVAALSEKAAAARQAAAVCAREVKQFEAESAAERAALAAVAGRIPALEEQKKLAVAARNFKEAGRVSAVLKEATSERDSLEGKVQDAQSKLDATAAQVAAKTGEAEGMEREAAELEKGLDQGRLSELLSKHADLVRSLRELEGAGSVASGSFGGVVAFALRSEILACEQEARAVSVCVCGSEELAVFSCADGEEEAASSGSDDKGQALSAVRGEDREAEDEPQAEEANKEGLAKEQEQEQGQEQGRGEEQDGELENQSQDEDQPREEEAQEMDAEAQEALRAKILRIEVQIEAAVEADEYEIAAELDETLKELRATLGEAAAEEDGTTGQPAIVADVSEEDDE